VPRFGWPRHAWLSRTERRTILTPGPALLEAVGYMGRQALIGTARSTPAWRGDVNGARKEAAHRPGTINWDKPDRVFSSRGNSSARLWRIRFFLSDKHGRHWRGPAKRARQPDRQLRKRGPSPGRGNFWDYGRRNGKRGAPISPRSGLPGDENTVKASRLERRRRTFAAGALRSCDGKMGKANIGAWSTILAQSVRRRSTETDH